ncbi:hypothetical protein TH66_00700 [Carbonactinospora thermoautotrophica]|uniref:RiboL-PSP-HEPN domain-containing protein n=1 Tax=Carbonactinospora thermoautotrophica TaxID=1469144 RepID=A0A132N7C6_9ACTN|nr:hypothetical protein [Carbonactinospora thermoautotrophica]KWX05877.1 hypothetical protein TH66_00700 [Carbonactinospora thermoautotrophica]
MEFTDGVEANNGDLKGKLTKIRLAPLGRRPRSCPEIGPAWWRLRSTHDSVTGLFDTLYLVRQTRARTKNQSTRGRLSSDAQDLLRAAIVFTSAGLDATVQALIEHAVPLLVIGNANAKNRFEIFIENQVRASKVEREFLAALKDGDPHKRMVQLYIRSLTKASFQGSKDLKERACGALGITNAQLPQSRFTKLDEFFTARNDVAHRLDLQASTGADSKPPRTQRRQDEVGQMCGEVLLLIRDLIKATATNLVECRNT